MKKETNLHGNRIEGSAQLSHELKRKPKCQNITLAMLPKVIRLLQWTKADQLGLIAVEQLPILPLMMLRQGRH